MSEKETIEYINTNNLVPFKNHPFKMRDGTEKERLIESIKTQGTIEPLIVRTSSAGKYEVISGHRRLDVCKELGVDKVPVIIRDLTNEQAVSIMVDANLHRENILPSEKAFAYKMKLEALKHQGKASTQSVSMLRSDELVGETSNESRETVRRYIRLTYLIPEILQYVDDNKIAFTPAVELSYLSEQLQYDLLYRMELNECTPSLSQAVRMKKLSQSGKLNESGIREIMSEPKANQIEHIRFKKEDLKKYFPKNYSDAQMKKDIIKALELLKRQRERKRDAR